MVSIYATHDDGDLEVEAAAAEQVCVGAPLRHP